MSYHPSTSNNPNSEKENEVPENAKGLLFNPQNKGGRSAPRDGSTNHNKYIYDEENSDDNSSRETTVRS